MEITEQKQNIIDSYLELVETHNTVPSYSLLLTKQITRDRVRSHFVNLTNLHEYMQKNYSEIISQYVLTSHSVFTKIKLQELHDDIKKYKNYIISTYVSGKPLDINFLNSIRTFCKYKNAKLLLIPCDDVASRFSETTEWTFDPLLANDHFIFEDVKLNDNLFISSIKLSAKHIKPTTGLNRIGQRNGSYIFASPKQFLEYVVNSPDNEKLAHAIMTTGAITQADYSTDRYMSERTSYIAESDHVMGAIVVTIQDDKIFHFRQVQADDAGCFVDLGIKYWPDNSIEEVPAHLVLGDWHVGQTDPVVKECVKEMVEQMHISHIVIHDFFDGYSISHHDINKPLILAKKAAKSQLSLKDEIEAGQKDILWFNSLFKDKPYGELVFIKGNHDEVLEKYLIQGRYVNDPQNHYYALSLAKTFLEGNDPLFEAYFNQNETLNKTVSITWLYRDEEYKVNGVELGAHGDLGLNGSKASLQGLERAYGNCVVGHSHSAAILRGVFRVGTSTKLKLDYNRGPSSWTQTHCLVYENGSRQLINIIKGKWK